MGCLKGPELTIWRKDTNGCHQASSVTEPVPWDTTGLSSVNLWSPAAAAVVIQPISAADGSIGVLMIGDGNSGQVAINGIPTPAGMHVLWQGDQVVIDQQEFWVSSPCVVEETAYDPTLHGDDVRCFLTKARLQPGQQIKICPGTPGVVCGVIYRSDAWDMAMQSSHPLKCPSCGYRADDPEWVPPVSKKRKAIDGILQLIVK